MISDSRSETLPRSGYGLIGTERREWQDGLALRYQQDPGSRDWVVRQLLPLVRSLARRYKKGEEPLDDLVQVGSLGLIKALTRFDPDQGKAFVAYAVPTITGEIRRHFRDTGWAVHVPRSVQELSQRVAATERMLFAETGRTPTLAKVAEATGALEEDVLEARFALRGMRTGSLDRPHNDDDDGGAALDRFLAVTDDGFGQVEHRSELDALTAGLDERDRRILKLRYHDEWTQKQIGDEVGVSQMHVSRLLRRIHEKLSAEAARQS